MDIKKILAAAFKCGMFFLIVAAILGAAGLLIALTGGGALPLLIATIAAKTVAFVGISTLFTLSSKATIMVAAALFASSSFIAGFAIGLFGSTIKHTCCRPETYAERRLRLADENSKLQYEFSKGTLRNLQKSMQQYDASENDSRNSLNATWLYNTSKTNTEYYEEEHSFGKKLSNSFSTSKTFLFSSRNPSAGETYQPGYRFSYRR